MSQKVPNGTQPNGSKRTQAKKVIVEKGLGHPIISSSSSHFFHKTDFEQYLFKNNTKKEIAKFSTLFSRNIG